MKVQNGTDYSTRELRLIFHQVVRDLLKKRPSWQAEWKRYGGGREFRVRTRNSSGRLSGRACVDALSTVQHYKRRLGRYEEGWNIFLSLPKDVSVAKLAAVFRHELWHSFGARHSDMGDELLWSKPEPFAHYPELLGLPERLSYVEKATKPKATKADLQLGRIEKLLEREKSWVAKQRRADTALKKIRKTLKYYEREGHSVEELRVAASRKRGQS